MNALGKLLQLIANPFQQLLAIPLEIVSTPKRILGLSLPMRAAILVFLVFALLAVGTFLLWFRRDHPEMVHFLKAIGAVAVLIIMSSIVVHYMVKSWLEHDVSGFPDIDEAWEQGLAELAAAGYNLERICRCFWCSAFRDEGAGQIAAGGGCRGSRRRRRSRRRAARPSGGSQALTAPSWWCRMPAG